MHTQRKWLMFLGILGVLGSMLPWTNLGPITNYGVSGNGLPTLGLFVLALIFVYRGDRSKTVKGFWFILVELFNLAAGALGIYAVYSFGSTEIAAAGATLAYGPYLVAFSGVLAFILGLVYKKEPKPTVIKA